jgi:hypothetical protein
MVNKIEYTPAPALDGDARMKANHGIDLHERMRIERAVVWNLGQHLKANGFEVVGVDDGGDEKIKVNDVKAAMEEIFAVDEASLFVRKEGFKTHSIFIVLGNDGWDAIADYGYTEGDPDQFQATMEAFDAEEVMQQLLGSLRTEESSPAP